MDSLVAGLMKAYYTMRTKNIDDVQLANQRGWQANEHKKTTGFTTNLNHTNQ